MRKIFFLLLVVLPFSVFAQKDEKSEVIKYVETVVKKHVVFVSYETNGDVIKVTQFSIYDFESKEYVRYYKKDIDIFYPTLSSGFTLKSNTPSGRTVWSNVDDFDYVNTFNFLYRTNIQFSTR